MMDYHRIRSQGFHPRIHRYGFMVLVIDTPFCAALFFCSFCDQKEAESSSAEATPSADVRENIDWTENIESVAVSIDWLSDVCRD
jgi:L-lysine 2,3-aminomutase